ncbi:MAG TPA: hypothetical protein VH639_24395 [Bryobacteraceae bacterium]|jgi:uncharacterized coiled-coil protein SlyX
MTTPYPGSDEPADRLAELERRVAQLEAQQATHHSILLELNKQCGRLFGALTALQNAVDGICSLIDPTHKPQTPKRELM